MDSLLTKSALSVAQLYAAGEISPVEMTEAALARQADIDPVLNTSYLQTPELAMEQASASEKRWWAGQPLSPLDGIPTTIKDGLWWRDHPVYRGFAGNGQQPVIPAENAPITDRMLEGGMVLIGKTTMCDFGMLASGYSSHHGVTRNPHNIAHTPGGSSSGAAAAVTAGAYPVVVGTDIVGSIRLPAAFCGLFGLKPSQGRVPYYPPASPALAAGPMTRCVSDAAALLQLIGQPDSRDFTELPGSDIGYLDMLDSNKERATLGVMTDLGSGVDTDPEVAASIESAARLLEARGHQLLQLPRVLEPQDLEAGAMLYRQRVAHELSPRKRSEQQLSPYMLRWMNEGQDLPAAQLFSATERLWSLRGRLMALFEKIDYLLCPTVPYPAFAAELPARTVDALFEPWAHTFAFNLSEQPAASINCGFTREGLPIGLQIIGRRFDDSGVLQLCRQFEQYCDLANVAPIGELSEPAGGV